MRDAKDNLDQLKLSSYEELKNAVESTKYVKEIKGMRINRIIALVSGLTALVSVLVLIWQSGIRQTFDQKSILSERIENLEDDVKDLDASITPKNLQISR